VFAAVTPRLAQNHWAQHLLHLGLPQKRGVVTEELSDEEPARGPTDNPESLAVSHARISVFWSRWPLADRIP